jgi:hypothetical protein
MKISLFSRPIADDVVILPPPPTLVVLLIEFFALMHDHVDALQSQQWLCVWNELELIAFTQFSTVLRWVGSIQPNATVATSPLMNIKDWLQNFCRPQSNI